MAASRPESTPQAGGSALGRPPPPVAPKELTFGEYFSGKLRKLGEQHAATVTDAAGGGAVFRGVSVWLDGRLDPPEDVIKLLIVQGGGTIQHVLTATHTTHIIASNLPDSKIKEIRSHKVWRPVVRPAWVVDSARSGRLLPTLPYILEAFAPAARLAFGAGGAVAAPAPRRPAGAAAAAAPRSPAAVAPLDRRPPEPPRAIPSATGQQTAPAPPPPPPALLPQLSAGADPRFLKRYNASSRLHYLGTARAERQGQVAAAILRHAATAAERPPGGPDSCGALADPAAGTEEGAMPWPRVIAHVDIDCFFAQVRELHASVVLQAVGVSETCIAG